MELLKSSAAWAALAAALWACAGRALTFGPAPIDPEAARAAWEEVQQSAGEGRVDAALSRLNRLLRSFPDNPVYLSRKAQLLEDKKDWTAAARLWELYLSAAPVPTEACPALGRAYERQGRLEAALDAHDRCLALDPSKSDLRFYAALARERLNKLDEAARGYESVLAAAPGYADAAIGLARVSLARGKPQEALDTLGKLADKSPDALVARAKAELALGRRAKAKELLREALVLVPDYADVKRMLDSLDREDGK